ncbi:MAG: hypothetical protein ACD_73C00058G0002 [uncultured bacterium]|nr:MAG: hypothetical protein ACD_73C00058G0002 [uncultured bacterium]
MSRQEEIILCALSDDSLKEVIKNKIQNKNLTIVFIDDAAQLVDFLEKRIPRLLVMQSDLKGFSLLSLIPWIQSLPFFLEIMVILSESEKQLETKLLKQGVIDVLFLPLTHIDHLEHSIQKALEACYLHEKLETFGDIDEKEGGLGTLVGKSAAMLAVYELIRNVAPTDSNVLISGESGTGKELIAKAIHRNSKRRDKAFIVINCAAMPETLFESELFGYVRGAFTGANQDKMGLFESANDGSIFLDEIGEVPMGTQAKLLRVLQEGEIRRLGESYNRHVNVRLIAATNRDLGEMVEKGLFREDLYYRLNVISIHAPPLRDRKEDIPLLAQRITRLGSAKLGKKKMRLSAEVLEAFKVYSWPGNVRELENVLERALVLGSGDVISVKELPPKLLSQSFYLGDLDEINIYDLKYKEAKKRALHHFNRSYIMNILEKVEGNISHASEKAGLDRSNFKKIIRRYVPKNKNVS